MPASRYVVWADELAVHPEDDELHIEAPQLHFITGSSLERLKNGVSVPYDFQLSLSLDSPTNLYDRAVERFAISYDLWEEKYSVTRLSTSTSLRGGMSRRLRERRSASHLSASAAETWCLDNVGLPISGIDPQRMFWLRLEVRSADPKTVPPLFDDSGISLTRLIDLFSHAPHAGQQHWTLETGPMRLSAIRKPVGRGS